MSKIAGEIKYEKRDATLHRASLDDITSEWYEDKADAVADVLNITVGRHNLAESHIENLEEDIKNLEAD